MTDRGTLLLAVADRAHRLANDGESAPDYRWMDQYIDSAADRYKVVLSKSEREAVVKNVRSRK